MPTTSQSQSRLTYDDFPDGTFPVVARLAADAALVTPLLPGFSLSLAKLFA